MTSSWSLIRQVIITVNKPTDPISKGFKLTYKLKSEIRLNLIIFQQDATYSVYYISVGSSTCFGWWHPSSAAGTAVITASGTGQPGLLYVWFYRIAAFVIYSFLLMFLIW